MRGALHLIAAVAVAAAQDTCSAPSGQDCYPASLYPNQAASQSVCEARGCCWNAQSSPPCQYNSLPPPSPGLCAAVTTASRVDCFPEGNANATACASRGCCWNPAAAAAATGTGTGTAGVSWCFYPHTDGYVSSAPVPTAAGFNATLTYSGGSSGNGQRSPYGGDVQTLQLSVWYESQTRVHFKITDPSTPRWEVPADLVLQQPPPAAAAPVTDYAVSITQAPEPFGIWISRKSDGQVLFDSRVGGATSFNGLIFTNQYIELSTALPTDAAGNMHLHGLGEHSAPFSLQYNHSGPDAAGNLYTMWSRDQPGIPVEGPGGAGNLYGVHPFLLSHDPTSGQAYGILLLNSNAQDALLQPNALTYRLTGGVLDIYLFTGPTPAEVVQQYLTLVGNPRMPPLWALGFHLCRWGYGSLNNTMAIWSAMQAAGVPQDAQWNDIDYMSNHLDFTSDPVAYPKQQLADFVNTLQKEKGMRYVQIIDPGISNMQPPGAYPAYDTGLQLDVFFRDATGNIFNGSVWPGPVAFPDFFAPNAQSWWTANFQRYFSDYGFSLDGVWIDMNELSNFCDGECGPGSPPGNDVAAAMTAQRLAALQLRADVFAAAEAAGVWPWMPHAPAEYARLTEQLRSKHSTTAAATTAAGARRAAAAATAASGGSGAAPMDYRYSPYLPGRLGGATDLYSKTVSNDAYGALSTLYNTHSMTGYMEGVLTTAAMEALRGERALTIGRSTFVSSGYHQGHWLGDDVAAYSDMYYSLTGTLTFNLFGMPLVGADTGFGGNAADAQMAVRWHQLGAFCFGFFRNHNSIGKPDQAPTSYPQPYQGYMKQIITARYALLPYWYTLFAHAHANGSTVTRPLFFEWPLDSTVADMDKQVMIGSGLMVAPVLQPNVTTLDVYFPEGSWYDYWMGAPIAVSAPGWGTVPAPLQTIPAFIRGGHILPLQTPNVTTAWQAPNPYQLMVAVDAVGASSQQSSSGWLWLDDGASLQTAETGKYLEVQYSALYTVDGSIGSLSNRIVQAGYTPPASAVLERVWICGVASWDAATGYAHLNGQPVTAQWIDNLQMLTITLPPGQLALTEPFTLAWYGFSGSSSNSTAAA